ncbi:MAG: chemotaxis response regulator protein-glutamate methylesterase [Alphaproteobacteria bacterium]|nr:chemotaxis response regulator protein-glutamate methylesterase [Alphaproteobacteria bacterium]
MQRKPIRVVVVDDSALMRKMISAMLSSEPDIEVVGIANDPFQAREQIKATNPDVVTLDVEMPKMDGLTFLEKIMTLRPMPVVMVSSLTQTGTDATLRALELGAVDCVAKPAGGMIAEGQAEFRADVIAKVRTAAAARIRPRKLVERAARASVGPGYSSSEVVVAIGSSTGGVEALHHVLQALPADSPAVVVTQHMPPAFTASFSRRLDSECAVVVAEATDGVRVLPGHVYIAPGGRHLELGRSGANYICKLHDQPPVSGHRPSVDVLFRSVARNAGANAVGVIMTGMGRDGADGLLEMRKAGARTIGQDEASCVVYGMPKVAREVGAVEVEVPLHKIPGEILQRCYASTPRRMRI